MKPKTRKIFTIILIISFVATVVFIWGNSMDSRAVSGEKSDFFTRVAEELFRPIISRFNISSDELAHFIRKLAHFSEYFFLGTEVAILLLLLCKTNTSSVAHGFFIGLAIAVMDESIQIVSGRGAMVADILLDFLGFGIALTLIVGIAYITAIIKKNKKERA